MKFAVGPDFSAKHLAAYPVLGSGVWGTVYDLGDGTVLKLAKQVGGLGDGNEKILHEIAVMESFARLALDIPFDIPQSLESGSVSENSPLFRSGYTIWSRMTKMEGCVLGETDIANLSSSDRDKIASSSGSAIGEFENLLSQADIASSLIPDCLLSYPPDGIELLKSDRDRLTAVNACLVKLTDETLRPIHGDFNITNILFDEEYAVAGVVDFAEVCLGHLEDDICSLTFELPSMRNNVVAAYEARTGRAVDLETLDLVELRRDMIGLLICRYRLDRLDEAIKDEIRIDGHLARLGMSL